MKIASSRRRNKQVRKYPPMINTSTNSTKNYKIASIRSRIWRMSSSMKNSPNSILNFFSKPIKNINPNYNTPTYDQNPNLNHALIPTIGSSWCWEKRITRVYCLRMKQNTRKKHSNARLKYNSQNHKKWRNQKWEK